MTSAGRSRQAIRVGMCASLSGQFQVQGKQALQGVKAWVEDANAHGGVFVGDLGAILPLSLAHHDDQSSAARVRELTRSLIVEERVDLLLGPYSSGLAIAAAGVAEELGKVLWNHGGSADGIHARGYRWTVSILSPASRYLTGVVDLLRQAYP
ncbi:MAG: ABC transporter substrate-binding protein, partial [Chloroflexi bacterium]|nr:ABC transporter substrate-binding protein [Chloroflexota bacterium]